jgi:ribosomal protein S18 acetylase RimI-like enzyme
VQVRSLGFRTDLMLRRLAGAEIVDRGDHLVVRTPHNPTFYWGNFLLIDPPRTESERWLAEFAREFPGTRHVAIGVDGTDGETGDVSGLVSAGLEVDVSIVLTAEKLQAPVREPAAEVRPLVSDADWEQMVAVRLDVDQDPSPDHRAFVERKADEARRLMAQGHGEYFGAFVDGVARASLGIVTDGSGLARYQSVETHPEHRRKGLASAMLVAAAEAALTRLGATTLVIVADPEYVAIDLYRALGFSDNERQVLLQRKPQ